MGVIARNSCSLNRRGEIVWKGDWFEKHHEGD
jgi:hypothetical protein